MKIVEPFASIFINYVEKFSFRAPHFPRNFAMVRVLLRGVFNDGWHEEARRSMRGLPAVRVLRSGWDR